MERGLIGEKIESHMGLQIFLYQGLAGLTSVFHASVLIDHEFCHNIVKVAVSLSGSADYFDNIIMKFSHLLPLVATLHKL